MDSFLQLFGTMIAFTYHCFDRIVIRGYLSMLSRPEHIVYFFREVLGIRCITKEVLARRTVDYQRWVESYARNHGIPIEWAEKDVRKEDRVRPFLTKAKRTQSFGVYFMFKSMEQATTFRSVAPKFTTDDPDYRILKRVEAASPTTTSTSSMTCWEPWCCGSGPSSPSRPPGISTAITSWNGSAAARVRATG